MFNVVVDTNVLVSALGWAAGKERRVINLCSDKQLQLIESDVLLNEFRKVIFRPKFGMIPNQEKLEFVSLLTEISRIIIPGLSVDVIKKDASDNRVLECALAGDADFIVSGDKHLLSLGTINKIRILSAASFLSLNKY